ncbi:MAG: hypothetical protein JOZ69_20895 [Myxococcales bacterium]|nr:hypothetical protein [Myxococcales bacterium]
MAERKDQKLTVLVAESDIEKLRELAGAEDVSTAHVVRTLIRSAHAERFARRSERKR